MARQQNKKVKYFIRKVTNGDMPREEAFHKALKPYFQKEKNINIFNLAIQSKVRNILDELLGDCEEGESVALPLIGKMC